MSFFLGLHDKNRCFNSIKVCLTLSIYEKLKELRPLQIQKIILAGYANTNYNPAFGDNGKDIFEVGAGN